MSEKMTRIRIKYAQGHREGMMEWGEVSHEHMVRKFKEKARRELEIAQVILAADPDEFEVDVVRGPIVQHHVRKVLPK